MKPAKTISAYQHPPQSPPTQQPDTAPGPYYVTATDGGRMALVSGPYPTHGEALNLVERARFFSTEHDARSAFSAFGTTRFKPEFNHPGRLQEWGYDLHLTARRKTLVLS